jgi:hypothetical protein
MHDAFVLHAPNAYMLRIKITFNEHTTFILI